MSFQMAPRSTPISPNFLSTVQPASELFCFWCECHVCNLTLLSGRRWRKISVMCLSVNDCCLSVVC